MPPPSAETLPAARSQERPTPLTTYLSLAGGVLCIGFSAIFVRWAETTGDVVTFFRLAIATLVMTIPVLIQQRRGRTRVARSAIPFAALAGLAFALDSTLFSTAVGLTTAANATLFSNTAPLWVGLVALLVLREKLRPGYWAGLAVALVGVTTIVISDALRDAGSLSQSLSLLGDIARGLAANPANLLGLGSGAAYATYQLITQRGRSGIDTLTYSWMFSAVGAAAMLVATQALGHPLFGLPTRTYLWLAALGLVSHVGGWLLINYAFGHVRASVVSVTLLAQPVVTALIALPLLHELPAAWHVIGGLVTLVGIYLVHRSISAKPLAGDTQPGETGAWPGSP